jgi:hypothetical protein
MNATSFALLKRAFAPIELIRYVKSNKIITDGLNFQKWVSIREEWNHIVTIAYGSKDWHVV